MAKVQTVAKPLPRQSDRPTGQSRRRVTTVLCGVLALSLTVRLVHLAAILKSHYHRLPTTFELSDMRAFVDWSDAILAGDVLQRDAFHPYFPWMRSMAPLETWYRWWGGKTIFQQEPLYVYALSLVRWASNRAQWAPPTIQLLIGSLQPLVVFLLARRLVGEFAAIVAAALAAIYGPFIFYQGVLLRDWMPPLMEPVALILLLRMDRACRPMNGIAAGLWLAACALSKSLILLFIPFALIWLTCRRRQDKSRWWSRPASVLLGLALGLSPLMLRNAAVGAPLLSIHNRTAEGFIQGNAIDAQPVGLFHPPSMQRILERSDGRLGGVIAETLRGYQGRWLDFVRLHILKLRGNFEPIDIPNNLSFYHAREISPVLWLTLGFGPVAAAGLAGLFLAVRQGGAHGLMLIYLATQVVALNSATVLGRYRLGMVAVLLVYAGAALVALWDAIRKRQIRTAARRLGVLAATSLVQFVLVPIPRLRTELGYELYVPGYVASATLAVSEKRFEDAVGEAQRLGAWAGRFPEAGEFSRALERDTHHAWARSLLERADTQGALQQARLAARINLTAPTLDHVHYQLGELFHRLNSPAEAVAQLQVYLRKQPRGSFADPARSLLKEIGHP